ADLLVDLVTTDLGGLVPLRVEVVVLQQGLRGLDARRLTRTQLAIDVDERATRDLGVDRLLRDAGVTGLLLELLAHELAADGILRARQADRVVVAELLVVPLRAEAQRLGQLRDGLLALAVETDADDVALVDLELEPGAARRDDAGGEDVLVGRLVGRALEVDA